MFVRMSQITTPMLKVASSNDRGLLEQAASRDVKSEPDELGVYPAEISAAVSKSCAEITLAWHSALQLVVSFQEDRQAIGCACFKESKRVTVK
jgi:hypothetical protein